MIHLRSFSYLISYLVSYKYKQAPHFALVQAVVPATLVEKISLSPLEHFGTFVKINYHKCVGLSLDFLFCLIDLYVYP